MKNLLTLIVLTIALCSFGQKPRDPYDKGEFRLKLALPYFNNLFLQPENEKTINKFGFLGESVGLEYSYSAMKFLETSFSYVGAAEIPFPVPVDREGEFQSQYSMFFSLTDNMVISRFTLGYGINYSMNTYVEGYRNFSMDDTIPSFWNNKTNKTFGLTINSHYRVGNSFNIGLIYRPTFILVDPRELFLYEHFISIELLWRIRLNDK